MSNEEELHPDEIKQFVSKVLSFSSQYGSENSHSYTAVNIIGPPSVFPNHLDSSKTFVLRHYGQHWINDFMHSKSYDFQDYIEVEYEESVFVTKIEIYETFHPGSVVKIFTFNEKQMRWYEMWNGPPSVHKESRIFSPKIKKLVYPTRRLRLEFYHKHLSYYGEIDAVLMVGIPTYSTHLVSNIISHFDWFSNDQISIPVHPNTKEVNFVKILPIEILKYIISFLDLVDICRLACVSRSLRHICYDPHLYSQLNLKKYWQLIGSEVLTGIGNRCSFLTSLDVSWCGRYSTIMPATFSDFIANHGHRLKSLKLSGCIFVSDSVMRMISENCVHLEELDMQSCSNEFLTSTGFEHISKLKALITLELYRTCITNYALLTIIQECSKLVHLGVGSCCNISEMALIARMIGDHLPNILSVDFWRSQTLNQHGLYCLTSRCSKLQNLNIGWCQFLSVFGGTFQDIALNSSEIQKLYATSIRNITDGDLMAIANSCTKLKVLDILGARSVTFFGLVRFLERCKSLQFLDISFCPEIDQDSFIKLKERFKNVEMKMSSVLNSH